MTGPVFAPDGNSTPERLWTPQVNMGTPAAPTWTTVNYIQNCDFKPDEAVFVDATTFASGGFSGQDKLGAAWAATITVSKMTQQGSPTLRDPAAEFIRTKCIGQFGAANTMQFRFFEYDVNDPSGTQSPRVEAYMGFASAQWPGTGGGGQAEAQTVAIALMGKGKLNIIAHPFPATPALAVVSSVTPSSGTAAGGKLVRIVGSGFTTTVATTGVKFGTTNSPQWDVVSDSLIEAVTPAVAASTVPVVVTNAAGASTSNATYTFV